MGYRSNQNDCCHLWAGHSLGEWGINNFRIFKRLESQKYKRKWIWKSWRSKDITILSIKNTYTPGYRLLFQRRMIWGLEQHKIYINTAPPIHWLAFKNEKSISSPTQVEMMDHLSCGLGDSWLDDFFGVTATKFGGQGEPWAELWSGRILFLSFFFFFNVPPSCRSPAFSLAPKDNQNPLLFSFQDTTVLELISLRQNMVFWPALKCVNCDLSNHKNWGGISMCLYS